MRVLHVNTEKGWRGGERQTLLTLRGLKERGVWAGLVARTGSPLVRAAEDSGVPTFPMRMRGGFGPTAAFRLARLSRRLGVDLLHLQTAHAAGTALLARLFRLRVKTVASRRVDFPVNGWKYNRFDAVAAISDAIRVVLEKSGVEPERIRVIPSGVPTEISRPAGVAELRRELAGGARPLIGAVGHLAEHKGHRFLVEALPAVLEREPDARLAIVGDGELRQELEGLAGELGISDRVAFTGFRGDALDLIWTFDLLVVPSLREGLCTTLLDAMLRGVPIVASEVGGIPEALGNGRYGALVPPGDSAALGKRIVEVLRDENLRGTITEGAAEWVRRRFSAAAMVEATVDLYRELLGSDSPDSESRPG